MGVLLSFGSLLLLAAVFFIAGAATAGYAVVRFVRWKKATFN